MNICFDGFTESFRRIGVFEYFLIGFSAWLLMNPYQGIWHDARVYLITAYQSFAPEAYARESWFSNGSQSDFSLFASIYKLLLQAVGVEQGALWASILGGLVWTAGIVAITRSWLPQNALLPLLALAAFPLAYTYTATDIILLAESFATARPYALGFGLLGLAAYLRNSRVAAAILIALSISLHPLLGIWVLIAIVAHALDDRWLASLLGLACMVFSVLIIYPPSIAGLQSMPELWRELVRETSLVVLAKDSSDLTLDRSLAWIALLLWAYRLSNSAYARWYAIAALLLSWALLLSIITSFHYTMPLIAQIQPWRVQWLVIVIAVLAGFDLLHQANLSKTEKIGRVTLILTPIAAGSGVGFLSLLIWLAWAVIGVTRYMAVMQDWLSEETKYLLIRIVCIGIIPIVLLVQVEPSVHLDFQSENEVIGIGAQIPLSIRWLLLFAVISIYLVWKIRWQANLMIFLCIGLAFLIWDQRPAVAIAKEKSFAMQGSEQARAAGIKQGEVVYWPGNDTSVWFEWVTANYFGNMQAIGIVFSELNALTLYQRAGFIAENMPSKISEKGFSMLNLHGHFYHPDSPGGVEIKRLCQDTELDHVISMKRPSDVTVATEFSSFYSRKTFWAYHCERMR